MATDPTYRTLLNLPADQAQLLSNVAKRLGCSQSALVSIILGETLDPLLVGLLEVDDASGPPRRRNGPYMDELRQRVVSMLDRGSATLQQDLFRS